METEQGRTLEALKTCIQMETDGKKYYLKLSKTCTNTLGTKLFFTLAEEEDKHKNRFEQIYQAIKENKSWPDIEVISAGGKELKNLFAAATESIRTVESELAAVRIAMDMENKTYDYYRKLSELATFESEKKYYASLAGEEKTHHQALLDYYEYIKNPAGWFTMKEHQSLDGG